MYKHILQLREVRWEDTIHITHSEIDVLDNKKVFLPKSIFIKRTCKYIIGTIYIHKQKDIEIREALKPTLTTIYTTTYW